MRSAFFWRRWSNSSRRLALNSRPCSAYRHRIHALLHHDVGHPAAGSEQHAIAEDEPAQRGRNGRQGYPGRRKCAGQSHQKRCRDPPEQPRSQICTDREKHSPLARPGLINGYLVSLFPLGAMLSAPAFGLGLDWVGVRHTLAGLAAVIGTTALVAALLVAHAGVVLAKTGRPTALQAVGSQDNLQATFWKLFTIFFLAASAGLMVLSQAASMVSAFGASKSASLLATTGITAAIAAARLLGGWLIDRLPVPYVAACAQAIALLGAIALTVMPSPEAAIVTLGLIGIGYGLISGVTAGAVASYWPKVDFGRIASRTYIAWCLAAISLPVLAGHLYDLTGGYETAVIVAGGANLLAVLVALTLPRQERAW
jgi:MFS transporter, OFA family, oxalate/formate antiporter